MTERRIAVIGGISGLTAAYILARTDEVTVFGADGRLGGHADTPTREERSVLGAFRYAPNQAVLHTDTRLLPACASIRASWNYSPRRAGTWRCVVTPLGE